jgi:protein-tyrosine phosphatase family protein
MEQTHAAALPPAASRSRGVADASHPARHDTGHILAGDNARSGAAGDHHTHPGKRREFRWGTGYADTTASNGVMRTGIFYRSEVLNLSNADLATLSSLGITRDIDLRTPAEIAATPDRVPNDAVYINVNIFGTPSEPPPGSPSTPAAAAAQFAAQYRTFVTNPVERQGFGTVLIDLANAHGSALYYCSEGKDRTGWSSALLQSIADVSPAAIMKGYLATDQYEAQQTASRVSAASQ